MCMAEISGKLRSNLRGAGYAAQSEFIEYAVQ